MRRRMNSTGNNGHGKWEAATKHCHDRCRDGEPGDRLGPDSKMQQNRNRTGLAAAGIIAPPPRPGGLEAERLGWRRGEVFRRQRGSARPLEVFLGGGDDQVMTRMTAMLIP